MLYFQRVEQIYSTVHTIQSASHCATENNVKEFGYNYKLFAKQCFNVMYDFSQNHQGENCWLDAKL